MKSETALTVVIPLNDEELNVAPLVEELWPLLIALDPDFELILVDDGSKDGTRNALLEEKARRDERLRIFGLSDNRGQSAALDVGFQNSRGRLIATMDGDLQIEPRDLAPMVSRLNDPALDFIYGWRQDRRDSGLKKISTRIANAVRNALTAEDIQDTGCPLKVFRRPVLQSFLRFDGMHRFLVTLAHIEGFRGEEIAVQHRPRQNGRSKYGIRNRLFRALRDCLAMRWYRKRRLRYEANEL